MSGTNCRASNPLFPWSISHGTWPGTSKFLITSFLRWSSKNCSPPIIPTSHLTILTARYVFMCSPELTSVLFFYVRYCLFQTLKQGQVQRDLLLAAGKKLVWHGRTQSEPAYYCSVCEVSTSVQAMLWSFLLYVTFVLCFLNLYTFIYFWCQGGGIWPAVCNQWEQQEENICGALSGLCP